MLIREKQVLSILLVSATTMTPPTVQNTVVFTCGLRLWTVLELGVPTGKAVVTENSAYLHTLFVVFVPKAGTCQLKRILGFCQGVPVQPGMRETSITSTPESILNPLVAGTIMATVPMPTAFPLSQRAPASKAAPSISWAT